VRPISLFLKRSFIIYKSYHANLLFVKGWDDATRPRRQCTYIFI
jgi:hypothetical protein